jgi:hypothetical protein
MASIWNNVVLGHGQKGFGLSISETSELQVYCESSCHHENKTPQDYFQQRDAMKTRFCATRQDHSVTVEVLQAVKPSEPNDSFQSMQFGL